MAASYVYQFVPKIQIFTVTLAVDSVRVNVQSITTVILVKELAFPLVKPKVTLCMLLHVLSFAHMDSMQILQESVFHRVQPTSLDKTQPHNAYPLALQGMRKGVYV